MLVIPAIDIKEGKCVRLKQGEFSQKTVYFDDPTEVALQFQKAGASRLHLVDLDGAQSGSSPNIDLIREIRQALDIALQLGGGIRTLQQIEHWLSLGMDQVIIGTLAIKQPVVVGEALEQFGPEKIILGVDARNGKVAVAGWQEEFEITAADLIMRFKTYGLQRVIYTDISRDGMLSGPGIESTKQLALQTKLKITASGGISSKEDLNALAELLPLGVDSVIVGRAFYERRILPEDVF